jgi:ribosome-associated protein
MADMLPVNDRAGAQDADKAVALALGELLQAHNGGDVVLIDLREQSSWTDFFIIATVAGRHVRGLLRHIREYADAQNLEILRGCRKAAPDDEWNLVDLGNIVIHLMTINARSFYELERLWSAAPIIKL